MATDSEEEDSGLVCYICAGRFTTNEEITSHFHQAHSDSIHTVINESNYLGEPLGEFVCKLCTARFKYSRNLREHEKVHKGATLCAACGKSLSSPANLRRHLTMIHVKDSICLLCSKSFGATIMEHMFSQHIPE